VLLNAWASPFGARVRIALAEKGVKHELKEEDFKVWADLIDKKVRQGGGSGESQEELIEVFKLLEGELGEKPYFGGEEFGFIDIALVPFCSRFYAVETFGKFSIEAECPKLVAWAERCKKKKSVSSCLPDPAKAYEWVVYVNKKLGIE
ncbi:Glutathione transferase, partial [Bertholletia excelsa]